MTALVRALVTAAVAGALVSCALLSKSEPLQVRYFTPEALASEAALQPPSPSDAPPLVLTLGRVRASGHLRERIAYRRSGYELGFYETRRWTERPEVYLRRALSTALFEQRGIEPVIAGPAPTLEVELVAFEHVQGPPEIVRVQLIYVLYGAVLPSAERSVVLQEAVEATDDSMEGITRAFAAVLARAVTRVADDVVAQLQRGRAAEQRALESTGQPAQPLQYDPAWKTPPASSND
jgi:cholesterol transport system auxiliary component